MHHHGHHTEFIPKGNLKFQPHCHSAFCACSLLHLIIHLPTVDCFSDMPFSVARPSLHECSWYNMKELEEGLVRRRALLGRHADDVTMGFSAQAHLQRNEETNRQVLLFEDGQTPAVGSYDC